MTEDPMHGPPPIAAGTPHRVLRAVTLLVYTWDELRFATEVLHEGALVTPWPPSAHAQPHRVPITLGAEDSAHAFSAAAPLGRFMRTVDFHAVCIPADHPAPAKPVRPAGEDTWLPGAFDELPAIVSRLRARAEPSTQSLVDDTVGALERLAHAHDWAARMELGASGFDNTETMRRASEMQDEVLAAARAALAACRHALTRG